MSERKPFFLIGGLIGCLGVVFCVGILALAGIGLLGNRAILPQTVDRIAYMDNAPNIQIVDARGENRVALTTDATPENDIAYRFPTWSPDSRRVAFVRVSGTENRFEGGVYAAPAAGGELATVSKSNAQIPFYLYWSPDNQHISFLTQSDQGQALMLGQAEGKEDARKLETGAPLYWAWSPDSRTLFTHIGGSQRDSRTARLGLLQWQGNNAPQKLAQGPAAFQAPQYSPDGAMMLYAGAVDAGQDALYAADAQGENSRLIMNYRGRIAFAWSPNGKRIAWIVTSTNSELPNLGTIVVSDADGKNVKTLGDENALAFYWSPDSQAIAYISLPPAGTQGCANCGKVPGLAAPLEQGRAVRMRWRIVDIDSGRVRTLATFTPTENFLSILPFFDQYARSLTFWSPDSQHFVYADREARERGSVYVIDLMENATPRKIGDGTLAVWSWK